MLDTISHTIELVNLCCSSFLLCLCSCSLYRLPQPNPDIDTSLVEEVPAKEPRFHLMPAKSALKSKDRGSASSTHTTQASIQLCNSLSSGTCVASYTYTQATQVKICTSK